MKLNKLIKTAAALATLAAFFACDLNSSQAPLSSEEKSLAENMGSVMVSGLTMDEANAALSVMDIAPSMSAGLSPASPGALTKSSASAENAPAFTADSSDTSNGVLLLIGLTDGLFALKHDSIWVSWDANAQDNIEGNENIIRLHSVKEYKSSLQREEILIEDLDGDGIANGEAQYAKKAHVMFANTNIFGVTERAVIDITSGPDGDFGRDGDAAEQDNQIIAMTWEKIKEGEVIASAELADADGDGLVLDKSKGEASVVDIALYEKNGRLFVEYGKVNMRVETMGVDGDEKIMRISAEEKLTTGRLNKVSASDANGNEDLLGKDRVHILFTSEYPLRGDDAFQNSSVEFVIDPGVGLQDESDNLLYEVHAMHEPRIGQVVKWTSDFIAGQPVPNGQDPKSGSVEIIGTYKDGRTASLIGTFDEGRVDAVLTGPEGNTLTIKLNEEGKVIE